MDINIGNGTIKSGSFQLKYSLSKILPYETKNCKYNPVKEINPDDEMIINKDINYYFLPFPNMKEETYDKWKFYNKTHSLLLGPIFVPYLWRIFPYRKIWNERRFREILESTKSVIVYSNRVRDHLLSRTKNMDLINKIIIFRACTYI